MLKDNNTTSLPTFEPLYSVKKIKVMCNTSMKSFSGERLKDFIHNNLLEVESLQNEKARRWYNLKGL
jgi:hypothetical protein